MIFQVIDFFVMYSKWNTQQIKSFTYNLIVYFYRLPFPNQLVQKTTYTASTFQCSVVAKATTMEIYVISSLSQLHDFFTMSVVFVLPGLSRGNNYSWSNKNLLLYCQKKKKKKKKKKERKK